MTEALDGDDLTKQLEGLPGWEGDSTGIVRALKAPDFLTGIRIVDDVAAEAEQMDHHPDIDIRWRRLVFGLSTHSAGGVTALDIELARRINEIASSRGAS